MKQLLLQPEQVRFACASSKNKSKDQRKINRSLPDKRYGNTPVYRLMLRGSQDEIYRKSVRCCSFSNKRKSAWFMQTNNRTRSCHISSNQTKRAISCDIIQRDMKRLLSSRPSPFPSHLHLVKRNCAVSPYSQERTELRLLKP